MKRVGFILLLIAVDTSPTHLWMMLILSERSRRSLVWCFDEGFSKTHQFKGKKIPNSSLKY